ncbi:hypothetical protein C1645_753834 [Glomus cerebriforme]|uniref:Uncharacterized protein n=1 Tax=Glomus cerebriforme TaxID=658196 RepID=A0A397TPY5_9GLOM|nr:hypothetical protein C1645_753834 [Glomus cerebriforme]
MYDIEKEYRERFNANKKMHYEIKDLKMQVLEAEKELASMKFRLICLYHQIDWMVQQISSQSDDLFISPDSPDLPDFL